MTSSKQRPEKRLNQLEAHRSNKNLLDVRITDVLVILRDRVEREGREILGLVAGAVGPGRVRVPLNGGHDHRDAP